MTLWWRACGRSCGWWPRRQACRTSRHWRHAASGRPQPRLRQRRRRRPASSSSSSSSRGQGGRQQALRPRTGACHTPTALLIWRQRRWRSKTWQTPALPAAAGGPAWTLPSAWKRWARPAGRPASAAAAASCRQPRRRRRGAGRRCRCRRCGCLRSGGCPGMGSCWRGCRRSQQTGSSCRRQQQQAAPCSSACAPRGRQQTVAAAAAAPRLASLLSASLAARPLRFSSSRGCDWQRMSESQWIWRCGTRRSGCICCAGCRRPRRAAHSRPHAVRARPELCVRHGVLGLALTQGLILCVVWHSLCECAKPGSGSPLQGYRGPDWCARRVRLGHSWQRAGKPCTGSTAAGSRGQRMLGARMHAHAQHGACMQPPGNAWEHECPRHRFTQPSVLLLASGAAASMRPSTGSAVAATGTVALRPAPHLCRDPPPPLPSTVQRMRHVHAGGHRRLAVPAGR